MRLKSQVLTGGKHLAVRSMAGLLLSAINLLVITRLIGPGNYGVFTSALAFLLFAASLDKVREWSAYPFDANMGILKVVLERTMLSLCHLPCEWRPVWLAIVREN